jgi:uncharacterized membrane protein
MKEPARKPGKTSQGLPPWVSAFVVVVLVLLLAYNIVIVGPEGYPTSVILGGLLGTYAGVDQFLKRRGGGE